MLRHARLFIRSNLLGCTEGDIRILDGETNLDGRVSVCKHNQWGTVCHNGWNDNDAIVVCRQLGFAYGIVTTHDETLKYGVHIPMYFFKDLQLIVHFLAKELGQ